MEYLPVSSTVSPGKDFEELNVILKINENNLGNCYFWWAISLHRRTYDFVKINYLQTGTSHLPL